MGIVWIFLTFLKLVLGYVKCVIKVFLCVYFIVFLINFLYFFVECSQISGVFVGVFWG